MQQEPLGDDPEGQPPSAAMQVPPMVCRRTQTFPSAQVELPQATAVPPSDPPLAPALPPWPPAPPPAPPPRPPTPAPPPCPPEPGPEQTHPFEPQLQPGRGAPAHLHWEIGMVPPGHCHCPDTHTAPTATSLHEMPLPDAQ
jgi:hypothetical protein